MDQHQVNSGNPVLDEKVAEWLDWDRNNKTLNVVKKLVEAKNYDELSKMLLKRLTFGTAGIRGKMGPGYNALNDLVIVQTAQGLLKYLEDLDHTLLQENGIIIGYDGRYNSKRFAQLTATVFLNCNYTVRIFNSVVPTPFVPYSVVKYKCIMGVMVTASHNPKEDNGFKVFGSNGSQIVTPADQQIQDYISQNLFPLESSWDVGILETSEKKLNPLPEVLASYMEIIKSDLVPEHKEINEKCGLVFVYTAMHGVGYGYFGRAMEVAGLKYLPVEKQMHPDPEFPTVKFPNPEEGKSALDLAIETAEANNSSIILANDPDADRLAAAVKDETSGQWKIFNGNELGALLGWWALHCFQAKNTSEPLSDVYMIASTVSSKILRTMADTEGFQFVETLTGFKWMGNKAYELMNQDKRILFAFEEAIGFMWGTAVLDKDGISAAVHLATMASYLNHHGLTLVQQLEEIYQEYGYHISLNSYYLCYDPEIIRKIFHRLRNFSGENTYPESILKGKYRIKNVRDLTTGYDSSQPDNQAILPVSADSQMITFEFTNGLVTTLRTSGTEPKVKYYTEMCAKPKQGNRREIERTQKEMVTALTEEFFEPTKNGLIPQAL